MRAPRPLLARWPTPPAHMPARPPPPTHTAPPPNTPLTSSPTPPPRAQIYAGNNKGVLADVDALQRLTEASRACVREFVRDRTGFDGRIGTNWVAQLTKSLGMTVEPWVRALQGTPYSSADREELVTLFTYLEFCLTQVVRDNELGALTEVRGWAGGGRGGRVGVWVGQGTRQGARSPSLSPSLARTHAHPQPPPPLAGAGGSVHRARPRRRPHPQPRGAAHRQEHPRAGSPVNPHCRR